MSQAQTPAEAMTHAVSGDEAMQTRRERVLAGRILIITLLVAVLAAVLVALFGLPMLNLIGLAATVVVFVILIAYSAGF